MALKSTHRSRSGASTRAYCRLAAEWAAALAADTELAEHNCLPRERIGACDGILICYSMMPRSRRIA